METLPDAYVRTAAKADLPAIQRLLVETWHDTYDSIYGAARVAEISEDWHSLGALEKNFDNLQGEFIVADDGEQILGMAFACSHEDHVDLKQLYVSPAAQGRGIGAMLLQDIEGAFDEAHAIMLEVGAENRRAIGFYSRHGFSQVGQSDRCRGEPGFSTLLLRKAI